MRTRASPCLQDIKVDVERTYPHLNLFDCPEQVAKDDIAKILNAVANYFPALGYIQGLNFIAATLLLITHSEEDTFFIILKFLDKFGLKELYQSKDFRRLKLLCF